MVPALHGDYEHGAVFRKEKTEAVPEFLWEECWEADRAITPGQSGNTVIKRPKGFSETGQQSGPLPAESAYYGSGRQAFPPSSIFFQLLTEAAPRRVTPDSAQECPET